MPELTPPQRNAQEVLLAILREEEQQTKLLRPISTLAQIWLIILIIAVLLAIVGVAFQIVLNMAGR